MVTLAAAALTAVSGSMPMATRASEAAAAIPTKNSTNSPTAPLRDAGITRSPTRTTSSVCGWVTARTASGAFRRRITQRSTLTEPAVDPTQPPTNIRRSSDRRARSDQPL